MLALSENVPAPLQVALVAPPPKLPASVTVGLLEHTVCAGPAATVAAWLIVIVMEALTAAHSPAGSSVVNVTVALPAVISPAVGV